MLTFGDYTGYIVAAYGISWLGLSALVLYSWVQWRKLCQEVNQLSAEDCTLHEPL